MIFKFIKRNSESTEEQKLISAIAETTDDLCVKITKTLVSLSHLRGVEHPLEEPSAQPYKP
jgi:hypothetical protein